MSQVLIKDFVNDIYRMCGNLTRDQLPLETVLVYLYNEIQKRVKQMGISEENYLLKSAERPILNPREQLVNIGDFGTPVAVMLIDPMSTLDNPVELPTEIVNFNALETVGYSGRVACAFYGTGNTRKIRWSMPLAAYTIWRIKFWYEPADEVKKGFNADTPIPSDFKPLVTSCVSRDVLPLSSQDEVTKQNLIMTLTNQIGSIDLDGTWENLFYKDINGSKMYGNNRRVPFMTATRRRFPRRF